MKLLHRVFIDLLFVALAMLFSRSSYICLVKYLNFHDVRVLWWFLFVILFFISFEKNFHDLILTLLIHK